MTEATPSPLELFLQELGREARERLAKGAGTTPAYIDQLAGGHRKPSHEMARALVTSATALKLPLTLHICRPDIWTSARAA